MIVEAVLLAAVIVFAALLWSKLVVQRNVPGDASLPSKSSIDKQEHDFFRNSSGKWWQPQAFRCLRALNELRVPLVRDSYIKHCLKSSAVADVLARIESSSPLKEARILDVGCGGGLLSEEIVKLGAHVTGIDMVEENIRSAQLHWTEYCESYSGNKLGNSKVTSDLDSDVPQYLKYICTTVEDLSQSEEKFDVVVCSEVIEHVNAVSEFVASLGSLVRPGGIAVFTTPNRTLMSFVGWIVIAEYVLRYIPRGTHHWNKFVTPQELETYLSKNGFVTRVIHGTIYNPLRKRWYWTTYTDMSYALVAVKNS